jgi:hypothetical protein
VEIRVGGKVVEVVGVDGFFGEMAWTGGCCSAGRIQNAEYRNLRPLGSGEPCTDTDYVRRSRFTVRGVG